MLCFIHQLVAHLHNYPCLLLDSGSIRRGSCVHRRSLRAPLAGWKGSSRLVPVPVPVPAVERAGRWPANLKENREKQAQSRQAALQFSIRLIEIAIPSKTNFTNYTGQIINMYNLQSEMLNKYLMKCFLLCLIASPQWGIHLHFFHRATSNMLYFYR